MKRLSLVIPLLLALACPFFLSARKEDPKKIVFIAGSRSHASGEHEFRAGCMLLAKALNEQSGLNVEAVVVDKNWKNDKSVLDDADAIVIFADGTSGIAGEWEYLDGLAKRGVGFTFMHYAVHPSAEDGKKYYQPWIGGAMESGWSVNPHWVADLAVMKGHEISNGVPDVVTCLDEFYYNMRFVDDREEVLDLVTATPTRENMYRYINLWNQHGVDGLDKKQTLMWGYERPDEKGRGVGFTGGHYHHGWALDGFRTVVLNAIVWTAGMKVPEGGVRSKSLTEDDLNANLDDYGPKQRRLKLPNVEEWRKLPSAKINEGREAGFKKQAGGKKEPLGGEKKDKGDWIYQSPRLKSGGKKRLAEIDLPLKTRDLYLLVSDEDGISHDWADWLEPRVTLKDGKVIDLTELKWKAASTGYAKVQIGMNCEGKPLKVGGKVYQKGLGVHARSTIYYQLPEGAKRIQAKVALDDGGAIREGGRTPASVRFYVYDKKPAGFPEGSAEPFDAAILNPEKVEVEAFDVPEDLEVTVWATSPMLYNPTNMDTDAQGRIWVAEGVNYRRHQKRRPEGDRIVVLQDTNGDGKADSSHTFVQDPELVAPLGVSVLDNQIVVAQPPHLIVYTDVDRNLRFDPKIDKRENLLSGFNGKNHDHSLHAVVAGPDGKWYFNQGNCGAMFTSRDGKTFKIGGPYRGGGGEWFVDNIKFGGEKSDDGHVWVGGFAGKMDPDGKNVQIIGHGFRNSYEHTVTSMGDVFQNDNDDPPACRTTWLMEGGFLGFFSPDGKRTWQADRRPGQSVPRAHWRQDDPGTLPPGDVYGGGSPTGICYYEHGALPKKYEGLLLSCEAAKRVVYGYHPKPEGANFKLERFDFFKSKTGNMFRPSDVMVGADGAIYVADWYDPGVGGHADRDGSCSGTIYRIAPKGFKPKLSQAGQSNPITAAIKMLKSPAINVRYAGFKILRDTGPKALPALMEVMGDSNKYVRARAIHLLPYMGKEGRMVLNDLLGNKSAGMRLMAMRSLRAAGEDPLRLARALVGDASPQVRREVAVALRDVDPQAKIPLAVELLHRYDGDRTYLEACGFAAEGVEEKVWNELRLVKKGAGALDWTPDLARIAWRLKIPSLIPALQERAASSTLSDADRLFALDSLAFIDDVKSLPAMVSLAKVPGPVGASASQWLIHLSNTRWSQFGVKDVLKKKGIYDPGRVEIFSVLVPEDTKSSLPPLKDLMKLKGNIARGKTTAARCIMCHQIEGQGVNFGPDLKGWIERQGKEMFLRSVVNPSEQIAQGYTGSSVKLKEGGEVQGLVLSKANPVIVQSQGGLVQMIPADKVEKVSNMKHSLMLSADQLGLGAQDLADLTSYLETLK